MEVYGNEKAIKGNKLMEWEPVIGLEVHTQLATASKIFSGASCAYGAEPNTQACAVDLGLPGVLPVLNAMAVSFAIRFGLSVHATIAKRSIFARKNYFYPDLPKGYQISQYELPIVSQGYLDIMQNENETKRIRITRAHLEEDAGKSLHEDLQGYSGIDLNRAGTPLLEIVSEPDMRSSAEAVLYLKNLHRLVRYIGISDGNMQEGSFRCDINVSLRPKGETRLGTRAEIKNVNSFRFVERAIEFEIERQANLLDNGEPVIQETRLYDADHDVTRSMRSKEEAHDYRYFPDPDLLPLIISDADIEKVKQDLPELPAEKLKRFEVDYGLSNYDAALLTQDIDTANYFEAILADGNKSHAKLAANWMNGELNAALNKYHLTIVDSPVSAKQLAQLILRIDDDTISNSMGKQVFQALWEGATEVDTIIQDQGLQQVSDTGEIVKIIDDIIAQYPKQSAQYRGGKEKLFGFFVGQVMKATKGKANPKAVNTILRERLQRSS